MMLEPNTKFAMMALADTQPAFDGEVAINARWIFSTVSPFELDATWQKSLGSIAVENISKSDFFCVNYEPAVAAAVLDDQNGSLNNEAASLMLSLYLQGVPGLPGCSGPTACSGGYQLTGSTIGASTGIREVWRLPGYHCSQRSRQYSWTSEDLKRAVALVDVISRMRAHKEAFQLLRRGMNAFLSSLSSDNVRDRLHQAVRSLEALTTPCKEHHGKNDFANHYQLLVRSAPPTGYFQELYQLRSYVEHLENSYVEHLKDQQFTRKIDDRDDFGRFFEQREAQVVDFARLVYLQIISDVDALHFFEHDADIPEFWTAVKRGGIASCACTIADFDTETLMDQNG
jgi:hypothetical protein